MLLSDSDRFPAKHRIGRLCGQKALLLPQPLQDGNQVKVQVKYTITSPNGNTFDQVTELPLTGTWTRGTRYTYTIKFGLDEIYLDPTVEAWDDVNGGEITI